MPVWAPRGQTPLVRVAPQRDKTNFYGSLDLRTGRETVGETPKMDSEHTAVYLEQILVAYPECPILLLWDRAPWHYGPAIRDVLAANPRLELMYFPTATPDLNPQEHVWKAARSEVSHNHTERRLSTLAADFKQYLVDHTFTSPLLDQYGFTAVCPMFM